MRHDFHESKIYSTVRVVGLTNKWVSYSSYPVQSDSKINWL